MIYDKLVEAQRLAARLPEIPDDRPTELRKLASANDPTALYYRFFFEWARGRVVPTTNLRICEIGTYVGTSAAHLAWHGANVLTIDINEDAKRRADAIGIVNLQAVTMDSMVAAKQGVVEANGPYDAVFIDGNHTFNQAYGEYVAYRPFVKNGGLIFFDDLTLDMATCDMEVLWEMIPDAKARLDNLHYTGFGACLVDKDVQVPSWEEIIGAASKRMETLAEIKRLGRR